MKTTIVRNTPPIKSVNVEFSLREAQLLLKLVGSVGGDSSNPIRSELCSPLFIYLAEIGQAGNVCDLTLSGK